MDLFDVVDGIVTPTIHALITSPYKEIWERDEDERKSQAIKDFTYIELSCSFKKSNPFAGYEEDERFGKVAENIYGEGHAYVPDELVKQGIEVYKRLNIEASQSYQFYESVVGSVVKLREFLDTVNLKERTATGVAVYKPGDITKAVSESVNVLNNLVTLKEKVQQELYESSKTKSQRTIGAFER